MLAIYICELHRLQNDDRLIEIQQGLRFLGSENSSRIAIGYDMNLRNLRNEFETAKQNLGEGLDQDELAHGSAECVEPIR